MTRNLNYPGDAPTAAELRSAIQTIRRAAGFARRGRGYRAELGTEALEGALVDAITLNLAGGGVPRVSLAEHILGPAVAACIGPSYVPEHLAMGSLGSDGRDDAREWAEGRPPADECFHRLLRVDEWAEQPTGGWTPAALACKKRVEALAEEVLLPRRELAERRRAKAEAERQALLASPDRPSRRRRAPPAPEAEGTPAAPQPEAAKGGDA